MKTGIGEAKNRGASCGRLLFFFFLGQLRKVFQIHFIEFYRECVNANTVSRACMLHFRSYALNCDIVNVI